MKVMGIDPGYGRCGVAIVEKNGGKEVLLCSDCIETPATMDFNERLATVVRECERLAKRHRPDCIALETLFFSKNQKTAMRVAEVRGALLSLAASLGLPVHEYNPGEVKSAVAGSGRADKTAVTKMLRMLVRISKPIRHDDEYDAIAIGLTHLALSRGLAARSAAQKTIQ